MSEATIGGRPSIGRPDTGASVTRTNTVTTESDRGDDRGWRLSWGAILAGAIIVLAVQFLLSLLGLGVGFGMVEPVQGDTPDGSSFSVGAGIWWAVSYALALIAGGYVAARLAAAFVPLNGMLQGLVTWAVSLMVTLYLLSSAVGGLMGGAFNTISSALPSAGESIRSAAPQVAQAAGTSGVSVNPVQERARELLNSATRPADPLAMSGEQAEREVATLLPQLSLGGAQTNQARDRIASIMAARLNIPKDEATTRLDQTQRQIDQTTAQTTQTAKRAADSATAGLSWASLLAFGALLIGALTAGFGGSLGTRALYRKRSAGSVPLGPSRFSHQ
jgi:hypothetical protein